MSLIGQLAQILSTRPDYWLFIFWPAFFAALGLMTRWPGAEKLLRQLRWVWPVGGGLMLAVFAWFSSVYLRSPAYLGHMSHIQPDIATVSWYFIEGKPLYHGPESAEVYNILYGPYLYIFTGLFEKMLGPDSISAKLGGQLALVGAILLLFLLLRRRLGWGGAILTTGIFAAMIVVFDPIEIFSRADSFLVLGVALGAWAAYSPSKTAPFVFGIAIGVCTDLKIHGGVYFLPLLWVAWHTGYRRRSWLVAGGCALAAIVLPFIVLPNISLSNYLWTLSVASSHGLDLHNYLATLECFFVLCAPLAITGALAYRQDPFKTTESLKFHRFLIGWVLVEFILVLPFASKYGSGAHHLLPMVVVLLLLTAELHHSGIRLGWSRSLFSAGAYALLFSWLVSCLGAGLVRSYQNTGWLRGRAEWAQSAQADVEKIDQTYHSSHVLLMGVSDKDHYELSFFRTGLVFHGQPIGLDPSALMEFSFAGYPTVEMTKITATLGQDYPGKKIMWLIPKGGEPFSLECYYAKLVNGERLLHEPLYNKGFQDAFQFEFKKIASTQFYDLYTN